MSLLGIYTIAAIVILGSLGVLARTYKQRQPKHKRQAVMAFGGAIVTQAAGLIIAVAVAHYSDVHVSQVHFDGCAISGSYTPFVMGLGIASVLLAIVGLIFASKDKLKAVFTAGLLLALGFVMLTLFAFLVIVAPCNH